MDSIEFVFCSSFYCCFFCFMFLQNSQALLTRKKRKDIRNFSLLGFFDNVDQIWQVQNRPTTSEIGADHLSLFILDILFLI